MGGSGEDAGSSTPQVGGKRDEAVEQQQAARAIQARNRYRREKRAAASAAEGEEAGGDKSGGSASRANASADATKGKKGFAARPSKPPLEAWRRPRPIATETRIC